MALVFRNGKYYDTKDYGAAEYAPQKPPTQLINPGYSVGPAQSILPPQKPPSFGAAEYSQPPAQQQQQQNPNMFSDFSGWASEYDQLNNFDDYSAWAARAPVDQFGNGPDMSQFPNNNLPTPAAWGNPVNPLQPQAPPVNPPGYGSAEYAPELYQPPTVEPGTYQPPVVQPPSTGGYDQYYQDLLDILNNLGQVAPGSQEPFLPSSSGSELSQLLQSRGVELLNRQYGYTPEEEAAIYERQINRFNMNVDEQTRQLMDMAEAYGWGGQSGQTSSAFQDYYGKRDLSLADLTGQLAEQAVNKRASDENMALQQAMGINDQLYGQERGNFADMLSLMGHEELAQNNEFTRGMELMRFQSDTDQRMFLNQQGISDRESQDYFMALSQEWGMMKDAQGQQDTGLYNYASYMQNQELTPAQLLQAFGQSAGQDAGIMQSGINSYNQSSDPYAPIFDILGKMFATQPTTNVSQTGGAVNQEGGDFDWSGLLKVLEGFGIDVSGVDIPGVDLSGIKRWDVNWGDITDWTKYLNFGSGPVLPSLGILSWMFPEGGSITYNGKTYSVGKNGEVFESGNAPLDDEEGPPQPEDKDGKDSSFRNGVISAITTITPYAALYAGYKIGKTIYDSKKESAESRHKFSQKYNTIEGAGQAVAELTDRSYYDLMNMPFEERFKNYARLSGGERKESQDDKFNAMARFLGYQDLSIKPELVQSKYQNDISAKDIQSHGYTLQPVKNFIEAVHQYENFWYDWDSKHPNGEKPDQRRMNDLYVNLKNLISNEEIT